MSLLNVKARNTTVYKPDNLGEARAWLAAFLADLGAPVTVQNRALDLQEGGQLTFRKVQYWFNRF